MSNVAMIERVLAVREYILDELTTNVQPTTRERGEQAIMHLELQATLLAGLLAGSWLDLEDD